MLTVAISLATLLALAGLFQFVGSWRDSRAFPPPGRMLNIGGRRLHAPLEGHGGIPVVFESGISASSLNWTVIQSQVQSQVNEFTTSVSYDRAGLGWSDPPRGTYDQDRMTADLASLLDRLNLSRAILVGHSYGGLLVRLFAERYPEKVAGLVLVDPVLACSWSHRDAAHERMKRRAARMARWGVWLARFGVVRLATSAALVRSVVLPKFGGKGMIDRLQTELVKLPPEMIPVIRSHWCRPRNFRSMLDHLAALDGAFAALKRHSLACPVIVISAGNTPPDGLIEHRAIAALSASGEHIVAHGSGHWIQFDEPRLVVDAIRRIMPG